MSKRITIEELQSYLRNSAVLLRTNIDTGRCAILFPHGVLFRNEESAMREWLIRSDRVECIIGLEPNLFYNSPDGSLHHDLPYDKAT